MTDKFHIEEHEGFGIAFLDDTKNIILKMADRIRELEHEIKTLKDTGNELLSSETENAFRSMGLDI